MLWVRRALGLTTASALVLVLTACGGLGVNVRSGGSGSVTPTQVAITATSGTTLNPYPLLVGHVVTLVAHPASGNVVNYSVAQTVTWDSSNPAVGVLLEPGCAGPYGGEPTTNICVFAGGLGKANANIDAVTANGAIGTITIAVTN